MILIHIGWLLKKLQIKCRNTFLKTFVIVISRGVKLKTQICPGATDARYIRSLGLPGIGFSPINHTAVLLHSHDEYLGVSTFLKGIEIYCEILTSMGNLENVTK